MSILTTLKELAAEPLIVKLWVVVVVLCLFVISVTSLVIIFITLYATRT